MMNTVHVLDLCRAIYHVTQRPEAEGQVYNVVDVGCSTHGIINDLIAEIFNISISYIDNIVTTLYKVNISYSNSIFHPALGGVHFFWSVVSAGTTYGSTNLI